MQFKLIILLGTVSFCLAQLPFQVKPRPRGFPGKRSRDDGSSRRTTIGRGGIDYMYRLNDTFHPSHYDLEVRVIFDDEGIVGPEFTAPGKVKIVGVARETTSRITLHANELQINASSIKITNNKSVDGFITVKNTTVDNLRNFFIMELDKEMKSGAEYEIYIEFVAKIIEAEEGLFYRTYETETGENRRVVATQLESVEARRMFPCFDEPHLKATFDLTVIRRNEYFALSNTELASSTPDPEYSGWTIDKFQRTVRMSTYNLALAITDYGYTETFFGNKTARIYAPKFIIDAGAGNYSAKVVASCLNFYESFFNESYKLSKLDSIVIPEFGGAMENWGLNIYGFEYLMHFPGEDSEAQRNLLTMIVAHELAHQWFGNSVTNKWWSDLYVMEGLSTYAQYLGMEASSSDLMGPEFAILDAVQYSMLYDAGEFTHPLSFNVTTPEEIDGMFDTISYEKGASIIRMAESFLTKETLKKALQLYLKRFAFNVTEQEDLFDCLQEAADQDNKRFPEGLTMSKIMHTWTDQSGFPIVKVSQDGDDSIRLSQQQFHNNGSLSDANGSWYIPVTIVTKEKPRTTNIPDLWLHADGEEVSFSHNTSQWIMINHNATGYYRVLYQNSLLQLIQEQLEKNANVISPLSRSQLLDDYFIFYKQGYTNITTALNLTRYLHQETHFAPWSTFFEHFASIYRRFSSHSAYPLLQRYLRPKIDTALISVGLEERPWNTGARAILRADLLDWSCSLQSPLCREYSRKLFAQWQATPNSSPIKSVDSKATLECAMVATGGADAYNFFFERYQKAKNDTDLREEILTSLACTMDVVLIKDLLGKTVNASSELHGKDENFIVQKIVSNPTGREIILDFLTENINYFVDGDGSAGLVASVVNRLAKYFSTDQQLQKVKLFIKNNKEKLSAIHGSLNSDISTIEENISWMDSTGFEAWNWLWTQYQSR